MKYIVVTSKGTQRLQKVGHFTWQDGYVAFYEIETNTLLLLVNVVHFISAQKEK